MNVFCFVKEWDYERVLIIVNKDSSAPQAIKLEDLEELLKTSKIKDYSPEEALKGNIKELDIELKPGEVKIFAGSEHYKK